MAEDKKAENGAKKAAKAEKKKKPRKNPFKTMISFFKSVNAERKKVVWPTAKETLKNTGIVLLVTIVVGVAIYLVDTGLSLGIEQLKGLVPETTVSESVDDDAEAEDGKDAEGEDADAEDGKEADANGEAANEADDADTDTDSDADEGANE